MRLLSSLLLGRARLRIRGLEFEARDLTRISRFDRTRLDVLWSASTDLGMVDNLAGAEFGNRQLLLALELGEPSRVARALVLQAIYFAVLGRKGRARAELLLGKAASLVAELEDPELIAWLSAARGLAHYQAGELALARASSQDCVRQLRERCAGVLWETGGVEVQVLWALFYLGELKELGERVDLLVEQARLRGSRFDEANLCTGLPALAWLAADQPDQLRAEIDHAMAGWSPRGFHLQHYYELLARASCDLYQGRPAEALARITDSWPALRRSRLLAVPSVHIEAHHLRARAALASIATSGEPARLSRQIQRDRRAVGRHRDHVWARAFAALIDAGMARDREHAVADLTRAAESCAHAGMTIFASAARRRQGELMGDPDLVAASDSQMASQSVVDPERFARLLVPITMGEP